MYRWSIGLVTVLVVSALSAGGASPAVATTDCTHYVSPTGSDTAAGTEAAPWKTLAGARDRIRSNSLNVGMTADLRVCLREGRYQLTQTFTLGAADSGSNGYDVVYSSYSGETAVIDGGRKVTGWTAVAGKPYWQASVPTATFAPYFRQLFVNGDRARLAAAPGVMATGVFDDPATPYPQDGIIVPATAVKDAPTRPADIRVAHASIGFKGDYFAVTSITEDGTSAKIALQQPYFQARYNRDGLTELIREPFYLQNVFEELDQAGEWYLDQGSRTISYVPRAGEDMATVEAYVPKIETLVHVSGTSGTAKAHDIAFEGLVFQHGNWALPGTTHIGGTQAEALYVPSPTDPTTAIYADEVPGQLWLTNTKDISFRDNVVRHSANGGLHLRTGAEGTTVTGNRFYDTTAAGIIVGRWMDADVVATARTRNAVISNNVVIRTGDDFMQATGISIMNAYGITVEHNFVEDTAYSGIHQRISRETALFEGVDGIGEVKIHNNWVRNGGAKQIYNLHDSGSIYSFGAIPGTDIRENLVSKVTTGRAYMSDNQSYETRWDYNVADGGVFHGNPNVRLPKSVYASHNYATHKLSTPRYEGFIFDVDGEPHLVPDRNWPAEAQAIVDNAGLEDAYDDLRWAVPRDNLADYSTVSSSTGWTYRDLMWDEGVEAGSYGLAAREALHSGSEGWLQFDFAHDFENLTFRFQNDDAGTYQATAWKVQRWSMSQNAWVDIMAYQPVATSSEVAYTPPATLATTKIRLYVKNADANGKAGVQEFTVTGTPKG